MPRSPEARRKAERGQGPENHEDLDNNEEAHVLEYEQQGSLASLAVPDSTDLTSIPCQPQPHAQHPRQGYKV